QVNSMSVEFNREIEINPLGFIGPVIVLIAQSGDILGAVENGLSLGVTIVGAIYVGTAAIELEPVAAEIIVVDRGCSGDEICQVTAVAQAVALVIIVHLVDC